MAKKILIFRTVVATSMAFVVKDILNEFGADTQVTIVTRPENVSMIKEIPKVKDVISISAPIFDAKYLARVDLNGFRENNYDAAVIPTEGALESYDNVVNFISKVYVKMPIYYWLYPKTILRHKPLVRKQIFKRFAAALSLVIAGLTVVPYLLIMFYYPREGITNS